jgi:hypothetical protein
MYLVSNIEYPAVQFEPTEVPPTGAPVYHEDREVTLNETTGSQMFRTYNAEFNTGTTTWEIENADLPAYATVQNPDGSIHYYQLNPETLTWQGSGNNAVYNAVDYGLVEGAGQSAATRAANVAAIQNAINAAIAKIVPGKSNGGGTVVIPAGIWELGGTLDPVQGTVFNIR